MNTIYSKKVSYWLLALTLVFSLSSAQSQVVVSVANDGTNYLDRNLLSNTTFGSVSSTNLSTGETATDTNNAKGYVPFSLSSDNITGISNASSVTLNLYLTGITNATGLSVDLYGLDNRGSTATAQNNDYSTGTLLQSSIATASSTLAHFVSIDITSYAKAQVLAGNSVLAFKIEISGATLPNTDGVINAFTFASAETSGTSADPYLMIVSVPEPQPMRLLLTLSGTFLIVSIWRRNRITGA